MRNLIADVQVNQPITGFGAYEPEALTRDAAAASIEKILTNVLTVLTIVAGIAFALYFLIGALTWITAGGKKDQIEKAKTMMTNGAIGLIIVALSYSVTFIVGKALGIDILNPAQMIQLIQVN